MSRPTCTVVQLPYWVVLLAETVTDIDDAPLALERLVLDAALRRKCSASLVPAGPPPLEQGTPAAPAVPAVEDKGEDATGERSPTARVVSGLTWEEYQRHLDMTRGPEAVSRMSLMSTPTPPAPAPPEDVATDQPSPTALPPDMARARRIAFGLRLRAERDARGWSQDALAQLLGLTRAQVSRMEMGNRGPSFDSLIAIRRLLGISLEDL